jgi:hypothetical protein
MNSAILRHLARPEHRTSESGSIRGRMSWSGRLTRHIAMVWKMT